MKNKIKIIKLLIVILIVFIILSTVKGFNISTFLLSSFLVITTYIMIRMINIIDEKHKSLFKYYAIDDYQEEVNGDD